MNKGITTIKQIHKGLAAKIKRYGYASDSREFRFRHIAYCLNRGTEYDRIEKPREQNELKDWDWSVINKYREEYKELYLEGKQADGAVSESKDQVLEATRAS